MLARIIRALRRRAQTQPSNASRAASLREARRRENERALVRAKTAQLRRETGMPPL